MQVPANPANSTLQWFRLQDLLERSVAPAQAVTQLSVPGKAEPKARMPMSVQVSSQYRCNKSYCVQSGQL